MSGSFGAWTLAAALTLAAAPASAQGSWVYVVNAIDQPLRVTLDDEAFPPIDHLMALARRAEAGRHALSVAFGDRQGTFTIDLRPDQATTDELDRRFWCFVFRPAPDGGGYKLAQPDPSMCAKFIERGVHGQPLQ